ncbi:hypothetical protein T08_3707 [Trichinella sp. T8]|nr:hypothetical protein T08_3707 [Trichinella sp. T8]
MEWKDIESQIDVDPCRINLGLLVLFRTLVRQIQSQVGRLNGQTLSVNDDDSTVACVACKLRTYYLPSGENDFILRVNFQIASNLVNGTIDFSPFFHSTENGLWSDQYLSISYNRKVTVTFN